ncbi:MAG: CvpA family protein [Clostridia bacterium]|nr:CvpA family protein [Clostridia bacterium]
MEMILNFAPIVILLFFSALFAIRGFLRSLLSFGKTLISALLAYLLGPLVATLLANGFVGKGITNFVYEKIVALYGGAVEVFDLSSVFEKINTDFAWIKAFGADISGLEAKYGELTGVTNEELFAFAQNIASPVITAVSNVMAYVGVFLISFVLCIILTFVVKGVTEILDKIPVAGKVNHWLGLALGVVTGVVVVVIGVYVADVAMQYISAVNENFDYPALLENAKLFNWLRELNLIQYLKNR